MAPTVDQPLAGIVLCCTSFDQATRTKLSDAATEMGAVHKLDLTSDVTHLLVGNVRTPKYKYVAKERPDMKVLSKEWLEAVREAWVNGEEVDVAALEMEYKLPPFYGLKICVTGFDDYQERLWISGTAEANGASYHGDLTKDVTHLIAAVPDGKKYLAARDWKLTIVSKKWFEESLERGMALDESLYDPVRPIEEQGRNAFRLRPRSPVNKRVRESEAVPAPEPSKKKLRRSASSRLESQSQDMWQDISTHSVAVDNTEADQWTEAHGVVNNEEAEQGPQRRAVSPSVAARVPDQPEGMFSGLYILIHGFDAARRARLEQFLEPNGAVIVSTVEELEDASRNAFFRDRHLLVPHGKPATKLELPEVPDTTVMVTEWWVERCVHYKRCMETREDVLSQPLWFNKPAGFQDTFISTTGFAGVDLRQVAEAVKLIGATYQEKILPSSTVLVCATNAVRKEKAFYAQKHRIPIVSAAWLWKCFRDGRLAATAEFRIPMAKLDPQEVGADGKDEMSSKRLSNTRKKLATPSLPLQASRPSSAHAVRKPQAPFQEDDENDDTVNAPDVDVAPPPPLNERSQSTSRPLREISHNASPRKNSQQNQARKRDKQAKADTVAPDIEATHSTTPEIVQLEPPHSEPVPPKGRAELEADIQALHSSLHKPKASSTTSHLPPARKNRPLGRAASGISSRSASNPLTSDQMLIGLPTEEGLEDGAVDEVAIGVKSVQPPPPSTQLEYESTDAAMRRVASAGTVKDSVSVAESGGGRGTRGRAKGR